jgi:hypothetical protein
MSAPGLGPELRAVLAGLADALIPAGAGLPSAVDVGVHDRTLDQVLKVRPDLRASLVEALENGRDLDPRDAVARLRAERPDLFATLTTVVAGGYLMTGEVASALRYPWQEAKIVDPRDIVTTVNDGLLDPVVERGDIWRRTPDGPR